MSTKKRKAKDARPKPAPEKAKADPEGEAAPDAEATAPENAGPESETAEESGWAAGELEALRAENEDLKDKLLRTVAEMENLRRRTERDKADTAKYAVSNFARDVLTIADNIQRAIAHVPEEAAEKDETLKSFLDGINVTERELLNVAKEIDRFTAGKRRRKTRSALSRHRLLGRLPTSITAKLSRSMPRRSEGA